MLDGSDQNAIRLIDATWIVAALARLSVRLPVSRERSLRSGTVPRGGRRPTVVQTRNGQDGFRQGLLKRYGFACAVTGPCPAEVLQAAHLRKYAEHETHDLDEGVLLRADVHLLFDNYLLTVDPATWRVVLAPSLSEFGDYAGLEGARFAEGPSPNLLREHFDDATTRWNA